MVFPVVMYGCESWTIKKAEHRRIDAFELWCCRRLLQVPWTARRSNQSILKEISPGYSLEGLMLKLKLQYFSQLIRRVDSLEKTLMLGKIEGRRRRGRQRMRWLDGIIGLMDMGFGGLWELVMDGEVWYAVVHRIAKSRTWLNNWTELNLGYLEELISFPQFFLTMEGTHVIKILLAFLFLTCFFFTIGNLSQRLRGKRAIYFPPLCQKMVYFHVTSPLKVSL